MVYFWLRKSPLTRLPRSASVYLVYRRASVSTLSTVVNTRGHAAKIAKNRCQLDTRRFFFSSRVIDRWNRLQQSVIESGSVNSFKNGLDPNKTGPNLQSFLSLWNLQPWNIYFGYPVSTKITRVVNYPGTRAPDGNPKYKHFRTFVAQQVCRPIVCTTFQLSSTRSAFLLFPCTHTKIIIKADRVIDYKTVVCLLCVVAK